MKVEVIEPHGLCAGVDAAIAKALKLRDVFCLHGLVHNDIVTGELKGLGFKFVECVEDVPEGATVVFSAHGVGPEVRLAARKRGLKVVDATCPFVERVHRKARKFAERGMPVVVIGDPSHVEARGIAEEVLAVPGGVALVLDGGRLSAWPGCQLPGDIGGRRLGVVAQTTMNSDDVARKVEALRKTYEIETDAEVCAATKERQDAVRRFCEGRALDGLAVLVLGSPSSSNCKRLSEVARECGAKTFFAGTMDALRGLDFAGVETLGVTSGASTPERFFTEAVRFLRNLPRHVAIVMDGNGRWAERRGKMRGEGHVAGAETLAQVLEWCGERGIEYLTVYAFSTENWKRPKAEVDGLMALFARMLRTRERDFMKNKVRFRMIGRRGDLSRGLLDTIEALERKTAEFERQFIVAISYGGRAEIVDAVNAAMRIGEPVTEVTFSRCLYAPDVPDPDLVIRTSGELRTSNFLLWESAYSEYYFTDVLWPDFSEAEFDRALQSYAARHRRMGGV